MKTARLVSFAVGAVLAAAASASAAGCATSSAQAVQEPKKCEVQKVTLSIVASPTINPTLDDEPRPVVVRIYQLKNDVRLNGAKFEQVWKEDEKVLADDVVKKDEVFVYPNSQTELKFERDPAAENVVAAAMFRNPTGRSWYASFELPPPPGKGDCTVPGCEADKQCELDRINPKFSVYVDETRVDDGAGHLDDVTDARRKRVVYLSKAAASGGGPTPPPTPPGKKLGRNGA